MTTNPSSNKPSPGQDTQQPCDPVADLLDELGAHERASAPADLEARVVAVTRSALDTDAPPPIVFTRPTGWRRFAPMAVAACLIMALSVLAVIFSGNNQPPVVAESQTILVSATPEQEIEGLLEMDEILADPFGGDFDALYAQAGVLELEASDDLVSDVFSLGLFEESM